MIFRIRAFLGIVLGSYLINTLSLRMDLNQGLIVAMLCAATPVLTIIIFEKILGHRILTRKLIWKEFIGLALTFAIINSLCHIFIFNQLSLMTITNVTPIKMAVGDFLGVILTLLILIRATKFLESR